MSQAKFVESSKGKKLLLVDGYEFNNHSTSGKSTYFVCLHKQKGCKAKIVLYGYIEKEGKYDSMKVTCSEHTHPCNPEKLTKREAHQTIRVTILSNPDIPTSDMYRMVEAKHVPTAENAVDLGKTPTMKQYIRKTRRSVKGEHPTGTCRENFQLTTDLQTTQRKETFLLRDVPGINRILVFATMQMLKLLSESRVWMVDGTFKLSPKWFSQAFTIHGVFMNSCIPVVYSLLPGKRADDYTTVLDAITTAGVPGGMNPEFIISDFEMSIIKSLREKFPISKIHGCLFHLCQSVFRRVQTEGHKLLYETDREFRNCIRSLPALAFVPPNDVYARFMDLRSVHARGTPHRDIIDYFLDNYVGHTWESVTFPIEFWNCYSRFMEAMPRTNNMVEGWHFKVNQQINGSHPTLWKCIEIFKREQNFFENEVERLKNGLGSKKKKKYAELDARLMNIVSEYNTGLNTLEYLKNIGRCLYDFMYE